MSGNLYTVGQADELRRAAYRVADATRQVEALLATAPGTAPAWEDLRWAHARLGAVLRAAPERDDDAGPILTRADREEVTPPSPPTSHRKDMYAAARERLTAAGWHRLDDRGSTAWVPPGSNGRARDRLSMRQALARLDAAGGLETPDGPTGGTPPAISAHRRGIVASELVPAGQARAAAGTDRNTTPIGRHRTAQEATA